MKINNKTMCGIIRQDVKAELLDYLQCLFKEQKYYLTYTFDKDFHNPLSSRKIVPGFESIRVMANWIINRCEEEEKHDKDFLMTIDVYTNEDYSIYYNVDRDLLKIMKKYRKEI